MELYRCCWKPIGALAAVNRRHFRGGCHVYASFHVSPVGIESKAWVAGGLQLFGTEPGGISDLSSVKIQSKHEEILSFGPIGLTSCDIYLRKWWVLSFYVMKLFCWTLKTSMDTDVAIAFSSTVFLFIFG